MPNPARNVAGFTIFTTCTTGLGKFHSSIPLTVTTIMQATQDSTAPFGSQNPQSPLTLLQEARVALAMASLANQTLPLPNEEAWMEKLRNELVSYFLLTLPY